MRRVIAILVLLVGAINAGAVQSQPAITSRRVAEGLSLPIYATAPAGDASRLFILEQGSGPEQPARISILDRALGQVLPEPFLVLSDLTYDSAFEGGLSFAFDPDYATNGRFYVSGIAPGTPKRNLQVSEYQVSSDNPNVANVGSERVIAQFQTTNGNHPGGWIGFGPEGNLYIVQGDGGTGTENGLFGQDPRTTLGKVLRISVDFDDFPDDPVRNYGIPAVNPFVGQPGVLPEIWAFGERHSWRASFDTATGDLYFGEVGSNRFEEINWHPGDDVTGGQNFGWPYYEGNDPNPHFPGELSNWDRPIHTFQRDPGEGAAVIGGYVYRGEAIPEMYGHYFYGNFITHEIASLRYDRQSVSDLTDWTATLVSPDVQSIVSFGQGGDGELFYIDQFTGSVYQIVPVEPLVGDADGDCNVGAGDYALWAAQFGQSGPDLSADFDGSGDVGLADYALWAANFGKTCDTPHAAASVPEPSALFLLMLAAPGWWCLRRGAAHHGHRG